MSEVFISYSSKDQKIADALINYLESDKIKCWIAYRDADVGSSYGESIINTIKNTNIFLLVFSENSNASKHVLREIDAAVKYEKTIIPFRINEVKLDGAMEYYLNATHWLDAISTPMEAHLRNLVTVINKYLGRTDQGDGEKCKKIEEEIRTKPEEESAVQKEPQEPPAAPDNTKSEPDAEKAVGKTAAPQRSRAPFSLKNRKILYAGIAAAAALVIGFLAVWSLRDDRHIKNGISFFDRREYDKAIDEFNRAIKINPANSDAYSWRGVSYSNKSDRDAAIADQTKAIELNPKNALAYSRRAANFAERGIAVRANADLEEALKLEPNNARLLSNCGNVYSTLGNRERALDMYNRAIQNSPKAPGFYANRGNLYYHEWNWEEAISDYSDAIRLDRSNAQYYYWRGYAYYYLNQNDNALADYDETIRLDPGFTDAYNQRGNSFFNQRQYEKALADYSAFIQLEPENYVAYGNRGNTYYFLYQYENAIADCAEALRLYPQYAFAYTVRGAAYNGLQRYDEAIADCNEALRLNSQDSNAYAHRGYAYYAKEQYNRARTDYDNALLLNPENYFANYGKFSLYQFIFHEYGNALASLNEAIRRNPYPHYEHSLLNSRAFVYFYLGRLDEALTDINKAIELYASNYYYDTRGTIYRTIGDYDKAIEDYTQAIRITPDYAFARMNRAIAYLWSGNQSSYNADRERATELDATHAAEAWVDIGINRLQSGLFDTAAEAFNAALALNPADTRARELLARARAGRM